MGNNINNTNKSAAGSPSGRIPNVSLSLKNFRDRNNDIAMDQWNLLFWGGQIIAWFASPAGFGFRNPKPGYKLSCTLNIMKTDLSPRKRSHSNGEGRHDSSWMTPQQKSERTRSHFRTREPYIKPRGKKKKKKVKKLNRVWLWEISEKWEI